MDEPQPPGAEREFLPLTDSLASRIRWRACDYASLFSAELELMLSSSLLAGPDRKGRPELQSSIRLFQCIRCPSPTRCESGGESRGAPAPRSVLARLDEA